MRRARLARWALALALCLLAGLAAAGIAGAPGAAGALSRSQPFALLGRALQTDCSALLAPYRQDQPGQALLTNPDLESKAQIASHLQAMRALHDCLADGIEARPPEEQRAYTLSEYFIDFAASDDASQLELVDLATLPDPAVASLRQDARIPPPPGFVYLRIYPSRQAMPPLVEQAFVNPQVAGVTILARYVAVLNEAGGSWAEEALQGRALPRTISHELVHAYVISVMGPERAASLPLWYHEGLAIYFSGSEQEDSVVTPDFTLSRTSTADYRQYALNFDYLEASLGRELLLERIRQSVIQADDTLLLKDLSLADGDQLAGLATAWQVRRTRTELLVALGVLLVLSWGLVRLAPEAECACGFQGRRAQFASGVCPGCGSPVAMTPFVARRLGSALAPACEVCGRRYVLWRARQVQRSPQPVRVWVADGQRGARPRFVWRICHSCLERSRSLEDAYHRQEQAEMEARRSALEPLYRDWLARAPRLADSALPAGAQPAGGAGALARRYAHRRGIPEEQDFAAEDQVFTFSEAVEQFLLAALQQRYAPYMDARAPFELVAQPGRDALHAPPDGYEGVVRKIVYRPGVEVVLIGSVYRSETGDIALVF